LTFGERERETERACTWGVGSCFIDWFELIMIYDTKIKNSLMRLIALVNPSNHALMKILVLTFSLKFIMWKTHSPLKKSAFFAFKLENGSKLCWFKQ